MTLARLNGKVALVTGARRGIGRGIALELAREGADVAVNDVEAPEELEAVVEEIRALGRQSIPVAADVSKVDGVQAMVDRVVQELGGLHIHVNNAGVESIVPFLDITAEEWERVTNINLKGVFFCAQAAARQMVAAGAGGAIINLGSVQAGMVMPGRTHYAPTKRGIEALTANLAVELAPNKIRVNCVHPGLIDTPMTAWVMQDPEVLPKVLEKIAMGRPGSPDEIGRAVAFLASDDASYITGQSLYVDGGFKIM